MTFASSSEKPQSLAFYSSQDAIKYAEKHQLTDIYIKTLVLIYDENE